MSGTGDISDFDAFANAVCVPEGYVSGRPLSPTATFAGATLVGLNLMLGTNVYLLPSDTICTRIEPAAVPIR